MSDKKYRICLSVPLGERNGTLFIHESDGWINGYMDILGEKNEVTGTLNSGGQLELCGALKTLMNTVPFSAVGTINGSRILLNLKTEYDVFYPISGEELITDE